MSDCPEPGIYEDVPFEDYCGWKAVNNSSLPAAARSPAHYKYHLENPNRKQTDALSFGTFAHAGMLEPLAVLERYVVMPAFENHLEGDYKNPKATNEYKKKVEAFHEAVSDKEIVTQQAYDQLCGMAHSLGDSAAAMGYLSGDGAAEVSIVWDDRETGIRCKGRVDKHKDIERLLIDFKTTVDCADFPRSIAKFGYHRQAAFYIDGMGTLTGEPYQFVIVACEKEAPYGCRSAPLSEDSITSGRIQYRRALRTIAECRIAEKWPGYYDPECWEIPSWAIEEVELTTNGEKIWM